MSEKTKEEIKEFLDNVKKGNTYTGHLTDDEVEYVEDLRKEDPPARFVYFCVGI